MSDSEQPQGQDASSQQEPPPKVEEHAAPANPATQQQLKKTEEKIEERMSAFERSTIRLTKTAVGIAILTAVFVGFQGYEMYTGGVDTHALAGAAKTQADRTKNLADRMKDQADGTKTIADQAVVQANANKKLADNAVDTLANTKQSFRNEQRAWVGVQGTADSKGFTETEPWQITVVFFNSGRTPARNVQSSGMYTTSPAPLSGPSPEQIARLTFRPAQSIAPQGYYREVFGIAAGAEGATSSQLSGQQILISQYTQIKNKQLFLYYFGLLKYEDIIGKPHKTQFCILLSNPDTKEAGMCDSFNDLN